MRIPDFNRFSDPALTRWARSVSEYLRAITPQASDHILVTESVNGTTFRLRRPQRPSGTTTPTPAHPFKFIPDPEADPEAATSWRTGIIYAGTIESVHPENDSSYGTPTSIVVPASTSLYKIWIALTLNTANGAITAAALDHGANGWQTGDGDASDFPDQPTPAAAGEAPAKFYRLLSEITTSDDTERSLQRFPTTNTNLSAELAVKTFGCNISTGALETTYTMRIYPASE